MNSINLIGNLTRDPESRTTQSGKQVVTMNIAVNRKFKREGQPEADFFRVIVFDKIAENCMNYLAKGRKIAVTGHVQTGSYEDNNGIKRNTFDVLSSDIQFLTPKSDTHRQNSYQTTDNTQYQNNVAQGQNTANNNPFANAPMPDIDSENFPF